MIAPVFGTGFQAGQIRTRPWLRKSLTPEIFNAQHWSDELLLLVGAIRNQHGADHFLGPHVVHRRTLFSENTEIDALLDNIPTCAAVFDRETRCRPTLSVKRLPPAHLLFPSDQSTLHHFVAHFRVQIFLNPALDRLSEVQLFSAIDKIHDQFYPRQTGITKVSE